MMCRQVSVDAKTGVATELMVEIPDAITEAQALARDKTLADEARRQAIYAELAANDLKAVRALLDGDQQRIGSYRKIQADLRAQLK